VLGELAEERCVAFLGGEEEEGEEVEEGKGREHADAGFGGFDVLREECGVRGCEDGGEC